MRRAIYIRKNKARYSFIPKQQNRASNIILCKQAKKAENPSLKLEFS
jgi:hypothetical protein